MKKQFIVPSTVAILVFGVVGWVASSAIDRSQPSEVAELGDDFENVVSQANHKLESIWAAENITPAERADDLHVMRRLSLVLHGTVPSLEEIRQFEADDQPHKLRRWTAKMMDDPRFHRYFAERLARSLVGTQQTPFLLFRRDRFVLWLTDQLRDRRPYHEMTRDIIADTGLWTGEPATNFMTSALVDGDLDENRLTGRVSRTFLGQRMDCAQCHNDRREEIDKKKWKQAEFEGIAAHFGQTRVSMVGIEDKVQDDGKTVEYEIKDDPNSESGRIVPPSVPFGKEWLGEGTRREQLANWVTHPDNRRFERAIANRIWGLMFGLPFERIHSVDDMFDPPDERNPPAGEDLLDVLGKDFREHGYDLRRLVQIIAETRPFRLKSSHNIELQYEQLEIEIAKLDANADGAELDAKYSQLEDTQIRFYAHIDNWAIFPFARLRPEQVIGSMLQAASVKTIDQESNLFIRFLRLVRENNFIEDYGDLGEAELEVRAGTIPQALLRMNGKLARETTELSFLNAAGRIHDMASSDEKRIECSYLVCFSRRPTAEETQHWLSLLSGKNKNEQKRVMQDMFWTLFNSPEFSWLN